MEVMGVQAVPMPAVAVGVPHFLLPIQQAVMVASEEEEEAAVVPKTASVVQLEQAVMAALEQAAAAVAVLMLEAPALPAWGGQEASAAVRDKPPAQAIALEAQAATALV